MAGSIQALAALLPLFRRGDRLTADDLNLIVRLLRVVLNIDGDGVVTDSNGIHIRRPPPPKVTRVFQANLAGVPQLIPGEAWRWQYAFDEAYWDPALKLNVVKPGGTTSYSVDRSDPFVRPAYNGTENGNQDKNGIATDDIGTIGPRVHMDGFASGNPYGIPAGNSYPANMQPMPIGPNGDLAPNIPITVAMFEWTDKDGKPHYEFYAGNAHDGKCA